MKEPIKAITYTGSEQPFVDRVYNSRLTFDPGQTRAIPVALAAKFLLHKDVFKAAEAVEQATEKTSAVEQDDTAETLAEAAALDDERRKRENERFELHQQMDKMDKKALRDWVKLKFNQEFHHNIGESNLREQVKGLIDQFGAP